MCSDDISDYGFILFDLTRGHSIHSVIICNFQEDLHHREKPGQNSATFITGKIFYSAINSDLPLQV